MKFLLINLFTILFIQSICGEKFSYEGYRLLRLYPTSNENFELLNSFELNGNDFDIWNVNPGFSMDVLLSPSAFESYLEIFTANKITFTLLEENIQSKINEQEQSMFRSRELSPKSIIFKYARYSEIRSFIDTIVANNADIASTYTAGLTYENRELKVIVLKTQTSSRAIWIDCGIHAREWVSPSTCVYMINELVEKYRSNDAEVLGLLRKYEFHILPIMNPDGYEWTHTSYRLWRKNRSPNNGSTCIGTDLNRNFNYRWLTGGSSLDKCSEIYAGSGANSELETRAVISAIEKKLGQWDAFVSIHSYGQWWLTPFGHSALVSQRPPDYDDLVEKAKIGAAAIKAVNGKNFAIGTSGQLLYVNTGSSVDYMYAVAGIKYSYVIELRPNTYKFDLDHDNDERYGFTLPEDRMPFVAPETYQGVKAFILAI